MDAKELLQRQMIGLRQQLDGVMKDTTDEQFNWKSPEIVNPISATFVHLVSAEDFFIQRLFQGKPLLWETGGWGEKTGLPNPPGRGMWDEVRELKLTLAPWLAYHQALHELTDEYVANLTDEELERKVPFAGGERTIAEMLTGLILHTMGHAGEIAALKGLQGVKGLPF